jgi:hypothetical protein
MMLLSQQRAGSDAVVERTGYLSWHVASARGTADCNVLTRDRYRCEPDLELDAPPPPPSMPAPPLPLRKPLRASSPGGLQGLFQPMGPTVTP